MNLKTLNRKIIHLFTLNYCLQTFNTKKNYCESIYLLKLCYIFNFLHVDGQKKTESFHILNFYLDFHVDRLKVVRSL